MLPVSQETADERELRTLLLHNAWLRARAARLADELAPLRRAFERFEQQHAHQLGGLLTDLAAIRRRTERLRGLTARVHAHLAIDPHHQLGDVFSPEELREIGALFGVDVPDEWFDKTPGPRTRTTSWTDDMGFAEEAFVPPRFTRPTLPPEDAATLRSTYRRLARQYHPDLATDPDEYAFRQELMLRINQAWHDRSMHALRAIEREIERATPGGRSSVWSTRLAWARRDHHTLTAEVATLHLEIQRLRASKTFPLWFDASLGNAMIKRRAVRLAQEIDDARDHERAAVEDLRLALSHWFGA